MLLQQVRSGAIMHILSITVVITGIHTWGMWYFKLHDNPFSHFADTAANTTNSMIAM